MKKIKYNKIKKIDQKRATIITRKNRDLNFGRTITIVGRHRLSDEVIVIPDGENKKYSILFTDCWIIEDECNHEAREKQLYKNGVWSIASTL